MRSRRLLHSRKQAITLAGILICVLAATAAWLYARPTKPWHTANTCSDYSGSVYDPVSPKNTEELVDQARGIAIATVLNPEAYTGTASSDGPQPRLRITEVIKGSEVLHTGDELRMCPGTGPISFEHDNHTVVVFLEGQNNDYWVPERGYIGIIPQNKEGRFETKMFLEPPGDFTTEALRKLAR